MNFALIASTLIIVILIAHNVKRQKKNKEQAEAEFWARERKANSVRRKSLDNLDYITIPLETFPTHVLRENSTVAECIETLETLTSRKIVNLTGYTNTDLKLEYGAANLTALSEYDQNYTILVRTLQKWADALTEAGYPDEACVLMEFAVNTGSDVSHTYYQLAEYYASRGQDDQLRRLKGLAGAIKGPGRNIILKRLGRQYPGV